MAYRKGSRPRAYSSRFLPSLLLFHVCLLALRFVDRVVYGLRVRGRPNLGAFSSALLVSNHTLVMDPGIIAHAIRPRRACFTMLEETALVPVLGTFVRLLGAIPIPEGAGSLVCLERAVREAMRDPGCVHVFPEGECYLWNQDIRPFHPGAFVLACRLRLPVVPITTVLHAHRRSRTAGAGAAGGRAPGRPRVTVVVGEPVYPDRFLDGGSPRRSAMAMAAHVRHLMQLTIEREGGSHALYRGQMPRLVRQAQVPTESTLTHARSRAEMRAHSMSR
jgi:1-acyl-sn-glycerol-3-phosphate acyltransferase